MDRTYHSHKSCPSTLAPLRHHSSRTLTSPFSSPCLPPSRSHGMSLLALTSHCYKNCLDRCELKWVWKLWGHWTSRRSQLFTWNSYGDVTVTVTVQTFIVTIIRDIRTCICIQLTQNIVLL
jgi:hypothetical protein